ncbi:hypothetical protein DTO271G3_6894 [Paecilomyces variotii]|nr:hypothetical protein DTO271G3_6894 [Paecilomyces variotii]
MSDSQSGVETEGIAHCANSDKPEEAAITSESEYQHEKSVSEPTLVVPLSDHHHPPPPNGGVLAWRQVLAGHLVVFNTWGYANSFGIFQAYYSSWLSLPASTISWIGSIQLFLIFLIGSVSGSALDKGYYRWVLIAGSTLQVLGIFMTSLCTRYWQLFLAQGICQGLGNGLIFCPTIALVSTYFTTKRTIAISSAASGAATGGIVFPLIAQQLLPRIGFPWTVRIMAFVVLFNTAVVVSTIQTRIPPRKTGKLIDLAAFKELPYLLFTIGMFFTLWATYFAYYYVRPYALDILHVSQTTSFHILLIFNAVGIPGRVIPALLADRYFSAITVLIPVVFLSALCLYAWQSVRALASDLVWIVFLGLFAAGIQGLFPSTLASLTKDLSKSGSRIGKLILAGGGNYIGAQIWGGTCLLLGGSILVAARGASVGWRWKGC